MFFCNVSIAEKYNYLDEKFTVAYKWLAETDIKNLPEGFYPLMGDDVIAGVQEYSTSPWEERRKRGDSRHMRSISISSTW